MVTLQQEGTHVDIEEEDSKYQAGEQQAHCSFRIGGEGKVGRVRLSRVRPDVWSRGRARRASQPRARSCGSVETCHESAHGRFVVRTGKSWLSCQYSGSETHGAERSCGSQRDQPRRLAEVGLPGRNPRP